MLKLWLVNSYLYIGRMQSKGLDSVSWIHQEICINWSTMSILYRIQMVFLFFKCLHEWKWRNAWKLFARRDIFVAMFHGQERLTKWKVFCREIDPQWGRCPEQNFHKNETMPRFGYLLLLLRECCRYFAFLYSSYSARFIENIMQNFNGFPTHSMKQHEPKPAHSEFHPTLSWRSGQFWNVLKYICAVPRIVFCVYARVIGVPCFWQTCHLPVFVRCADKIIILHMMW